MGSLEPIKSLSHRNALCKLFLPEPRPDARGDISLKCHEDWWRVSLSVVTLLPPLSLFLSQACLLPALTFSRPCLREARRPKCHSKIYSSEHRPVERREGGGNQVEKGREQINLSIHQLSIFKLYFILFLFTPPPFTLVHLSAVLKLAYPSRDLNIIFNHSNLGSFWSRDTRRVNL